MNQNHSWVRRQTAVLLSATLALSPVLAVPAFAAEGGADKPAAAASAGPAEGERDTLDVEVPEGDQPATDSEQQPAEDEESTPVPAAAEATPAAEGDNAGSEEAPAEEPEDETATTQNDVNSAQDGKLELRGTITEDLTISKKLDITAADDTVVKGSIKLTASAAGSTINGVTFELGTDTPKMGSYSLDGKDGQDLGGASLTSLSIGAKNVTVSNSRFTISKDANVTRQLNCIWVGPGCDVVNVSGNVFNIARHGRYLTNATNIGSDSWSWVAVNIGGNADSSVDNVTVSGNTLNGTVGNELLPSLPEASVSAGKKVYATMNLVVANGNSSTGHGIKTLKITDNHVNDSTGGKASESGVYGVSVMNVASTTISGNEFNGAAAVTSSKWGEQSANGDISVSGNTVNSYTGFNFVPGSTTDGKLVVDSTNTFGGANEVQYKGELVAVDQDGKTYSSVAKALEAGVANVALLKDTEENVEIEANQTVTLDLNGHKLTNKVEEGKGATHTITNNGTLTVKDSVGGGVVDNVSHAKAALSNAEGATATLNGGTFKRSQEKGEVVLRDGKWTDQSNGNSYYTIQNKGSLTINDGTAVQLFREGVEGHESDIAGMSSVIANGWYDGRPSKDGYQAELIINGGTITGGKYLKNDSYGKLTINGGTIKGQRAAVFNYNVAAINGGAFATQDDATPVLWNYPYTDAEKGQLEVTGGTFTANEGQFVLSNSADENATSRGSIAISGGSFAGPIKADSEKADLAISGGSFSTEPDPAYVVPGSGFGQNADGTWGVVKAEIVSDGSLVKDGVYTYDVRDGREVTKGDLLKLVTMNVDGYNLDVNDSNLPALNVAIGAKNTDKSFEFTFGAKKDGAAESKVLPLTIAVKLVDSTAVPQPEPTPDTHKVTFVWGGSADSVIAEVEDGKQVTAPTETPTLEGRTFTGKWYLTRDPKTGEVSGEYDFSKPVTEDVTLYAGWLANGSGTPVDPERPATPGQPAKPSTPDNGGTKPAGTATPADAKKPAVPDTGDRTSAAVPAALAAAGVAAAAGAVAWRRRSER